MADSSDVSDAPDTAPLTPWPERTFPLEEVRRWVASALALPTSVAVRVTAVYAAYEDAPDLRVTARLTIVEEGDAPREVVFKGNRFPLLAGSARVHALLSRHCAGTVPHVLAWDEDKSDGSSRLLLQPFEGQIVEASGAPDLLAETARTLAWIQNMIAVSGEVEMIDLPRVTAEDVPTLFDAVYDHIAAHLSAWQEDEGGSLSKWLGFPAADVRATLDAARPQVRQCAAEVAALHLPPTIDHGDLHGGNAVVQADGSVLIYDWETATVGCLPFSVEKLLVSAWRADAKPEGGGPWGYAPNTPTQALVRDAYRDAFSKLNVLDGGDSIVVSDATFAAAMALAVVKEMHTEIVWANVMGWRDGNPEWTAQLIHRLRCHLNTWKAAKE